MEKVALFIGRFAPPHKGHIVAIKNLLKTNDKVVIGLGSCYNVGISRHPLLAVFREKMILSSLNSEQIDLNKIEFAHVPDYPTFEEWIENVLVLCRQKKVTHFVTGNKEDILNVLNEKKIELPFEFINPELSSGIEYHASDLRKAIIEGDYEKFNSIASFGTVNLMANVKGFNGIREAIENVGPSFYGGRQTADLVFTLQERIVPENNVPYYKTFVLCGTRDKNKLSFPSYLGLLGDEIKLFESPLSTVVRAMKEKTNIDVKVCNNTIEPAHVLVDTGSKKEIAEMKFLKLYSSPNLAGVQGGSSQCFSMNIKISPKKFTNIKSLSLYKNVGFVPVNEAIEQGLAYEQTQMVKDAIKEL